MPARLLAYGGTGFIERRRIGSWPPMPEAMLREAYGLTSQAWSYGLGVLAQQPFLILRQRQNIENRGGYPFTLLLDPGIEVWQRFDWNGAWIIATLLAENPEPLFRTPETCSADALERLLASVNPPARPDPASELCDPLVASALAPDPVVIAQARPEAAVLAASLASLPVCFRTGRGWLVGGGGAHGRALGANLVIDHQASADGADYRQTSQIMMDAWASARQRGLVQSLESKPMWTWDENPADVLNAVLLLREIESADSPRDELIDRAGQAVVFRSEMDRSVGDLLTRGSGPMGPKTSVALLQLALKDKRKLDVTVTERLDERVLRAELRKLGCPPKRIPAALPLSRDLRVQLWVEYLDALASDIRSNLAEALKQLPEARDQLIASALRALPSSDEKLSGWVRFRSDPETWELLAEPLRIEPLRRFRQSVKGAVEAYLLLADDPGGRFANELLPNDDEAARLVAEIRAFGTPEALEWLEALKSSPLQSRLPKPPAARRPVIKPVRNEEESLEDAVRKLLFESDPDSVEKRAGKIHKLDDLNTQEAREALEPMVEECCEGYGDRFREAFHGKYLALADAFSFLSEASQDRLMECLADTHVKQFAARDLSYALNNRISRNEYTRALSRMVMRDKQLRKKIGMQMGGVLPDELEKKLKGMLKDGRRS